MFPKVITDSIYTVLCRTATRSFRVSVEGKQRGRVNRACGEKRVEIIIGRERGENVGCNLKKRWRVANC